jgi:hypothetical protein
MKRALVLIGVQSTGKMPQLPGVRDALQAMRDWASNQGIPDDLIAEISDLDGAVVAAADVFATVKRFIEKPSLEQLLIFFCGHGIAIAYSEFWLLSGAPADPNAAVNVAKSAEMASHGRVPHVVFVSDSCRTAAPTIEFQSITGTVIVPNPTGTRPSNAVDVFYACLLGDPAHEVQDPHVAAKYHAIYTEAFTSGLEGSYPESLDPGVEDGVAVNFIRPGQLAKALPDRVADRIEQLNATFSISQWPDARISYNPQAWLSRIQIAESAPPPVTVGDDWDSRTTDPDGAGLRGAKFRPPPPPHSPSRPAPATSAAVAAVKRLRARIHLTHAPRTGVAFRGADVADVWVARGTQASWHGPAIEVGLPDDTSVGRVLACLDCGVCAVLPIIRNYAAIATIEDNQLVDVWFAASSTRAAAQDTVNYPAFRAEVAARARYGLRTPEGGWSTALHDDPSIAIYRAYALADTGRWDEIADVNDQLQTVLGTTFFDLQLLAAATPTSAPPGFPLLSRGWALLDAASAAGVYPTPMNSLWTLFPESSVSQLRKSLE